MAAEKDILDKDLEQASSGGGMVCQIAIYGAYSTFISGVAPKDNNHLYTDGASKAKAQEKGKALNEEHGIKDAKGNTKAPMQTACMVMYRDSVLGREVTWQDDRYNTYGPTFGPDYKVFLEKRKAVNIPVGKKVWARVSWMTSPNAEANQEKDWAWNEYQGERRLQSMAYPVEVYASKKEAAEAAANLGANGGEVTDPSYPGDHTGWKLADWQNMKGEIIAEYKKLVDGGTPDMVAKKKVCETYEIKTLIGDPDPEKVTLLLTEQVV